MVEGINNSGDFLLRMAASSRQRVTIAETKRSAAELKAAIETLPLPPALKLSGFDIIAEVKQRSPATGGLADANFNISDQIDAYAAGGAAAISVLTEPDQFHGSLDDLTVAARQLVPLEIPAMRKDFLVDSYQLLEARAAGAGGALIIIAILNDEQITTLLDTAEQLSLFVLLEAFSEQDIERGVTLLKLRPPGRQPILFGVNCRDLSTLQIDFNRFEPFSKHLPVGFNAVAESGLQQPTDAAKVAQWGYSLALVGSALMRAGDPATALANMVAAGRSPSEAANVR
jgi:indole-3-glycerol phosphate synthase